LREAHAAFAMPFAAKGQPMISIETRKKAARRYCEELFTKGDLRVADEILSEDVTFQGPFGRVKGRNAFKQFVTTLRDAFYDFHMTVDFEIAEGDYVASHFMMYGTHRGDYHGIPATGLPIAVPGIDIFKFAGEQIVDVSAVIDSLKIFQQLGAVPSRQ
jgi:steroid delta-isomerase-like uncharacterized protein